MHPDFPDKLSKMKKNDLKSNIPTMGFGSQDGEGVSKRKETEHSLSVTEKGKHLDMCSSNLEPSFKAQD